MEVVVLYLEGCPSKELAESRVRLAVENVGAAVQIRSQRVESVAEANLLGFGGSPTVLLDAVDVFGGHSRVDGLTCRLYRTEHGLEGAPSLDDLIRAISQIEEVYNRG
jgi:hypothetical protein